MVTLAGTQNFSEFELHARAVLGIPITSISLDRNGASAVVLAHHESTVFPSYDGMIDAAQVPNTDFKIFGKPSARPYRRMGVALAYGDNDVKELVTIAKSVAEKIKVK
jgi:phosphoribosylglycinamide formyltransferase 2